jgi:hypothetical protein
MRRRFTTAGRKWATPTTVLFGGGPSRKSCEIQNPQRLKQQEILGQALMPGFKEDGFPVARWPHVEIALAQDRCTKQNEMKPDQSIFSTTFSDRLKAG